jgi:hypothetical protein
MILQDQVNVTDSKIRGFVVLKKQDGTVVFKKENMIVESGRKFIREKFLIAGVSGQNSYLGDYAVYSLTHIGFGNSDVVTEYNMTSLVSENKSLRIPVVTQNTTADTAQMFIKFSGEVDLTTASEGYTVKELGLILTAEDEDDDLFSRIVFDPIVIGATDTYTVEYYIYF